MTDSANPRRTHSTDAGAGRDLSGEAEPEHATHYPDPEIDNPEEPRCPICGGAIDQTDVVCPHCGESLVAG